MTSHDIVTRLRQQADGFLIDCPVGPRMAADEIERLRAERDEARRDFCYCDDGWPLSDEQARQRAADLDWDCFKEGT